MPNINPPLLFGIDPDETWEYLPKAVRAAGATEPVFVLKSPSLAISIKREAFLSETTAAARAAAPDALQVLRSLNATGGKLEALPENATDAEKQEYSEKQESVKKALLDWATAWGNAVSARSEEERAITEKFLSDGLVEWRSLSSSSGRVIDFAANKNRIMEVLRGSIVSELCEAIAAGSTLSQEEQVGLLLSQESQSV